MNTIDEHVLRQALYPDDKAVDGLGRSLKDIHHSAVRELALEIMIHRNVCPSEAFELAKAFIEEAAREWETAYNDKLKDRIGIHK